MKKDVTEAPVDEAFYKTLLESTKAIPWRIDWATMEFSYIGPQIEELLGWAQDSWVSVNDWADRMHPEDREKTVSYCVSQSESGLDHEADYRALTRDGGYAWIRDVVHVVRKDNGEVDSLVGFMFDISGVGTVIPTHSTSPLAFIEEVDQQLYRAKANGRNCIANMSR